MIKYLAICIILLNIACHPLYKTDFKKLKCDKLVIASISDGRKDTLIFLNNLEREIDYKFSKYFNGNSKICYLTATVNRIQKGTVYRDTGEVGRENFKLVMDYILETNNKEKFSGQIMTFTSTDVSRYVYSDASKKEKEERNSAKILADLLVKDVIRSLEKNISNDVILNIDEINKGSIEPRLNRL